MRLSGTVICSQLLLVLVACSGSPADVNPGSGAASGGADKGGRAGSALGGENNRNTGSTASSSGGASGEGQAGSSNPWGGAGTSDGGDGAQAGGTTGQNGGAGTGLGGGGAVGAAGGNGGSCADVTSQTTALPPVLEFVIDITGSMDHPSDPNDDGSPSKWIEMQRVLPASFASLPSDWAVGIMYFNLEPSEETCFSGRQSVPIAPLSQTQLTSINRSIAGQTPVGATPTMAAWQYGLSQISGWTPPPEYASSPRYVVLITDGIPTITNDGCYKGRNSVSNGSDAILEPEYNAFVSAVKTQGTDTGIKTFVVGVLDSDNPQGADYDPLYKLSQLAVAGGTEQPQGCVPAAGTPSGTTVSPRGEYCHFDMTTNPDFAGGLTQALQSIATQVISCSYQVPAPPTGKIIDPNNIEVTYIPSAGAARRLTRASDSSCSDGQWYVSARDAIGIPSALQLCPSTCDTAKADAGAQVSLTFKCIIQQ